MSPVGDIDTCPKLDGEMHYAVVSPTMTWYSSRWLEPPEPYVSFVIVSARNKRDAVKGALKTDDFDEWRTYARQDGINPFSGVKAELARCEHGSCWACNADEESTGCPTCDAACAEEWAKFESEIGS